MTKPNGRPCSRCGKSPKIGRQLCVDCIGKCGVCGGPAGLRPDGQFRSKCKNCGWTNKRVTCSRCGGVRDGSHNQYCRVCYRAYAADWAKKNPEKVRAKNRRRDLKRTYGITPEVWDAMLDRQGGTCAICETPPGRGRAFHVDHDHATGRVRALLCGRCNVALGMAGEDPARLRAMAEYLESFG